ncbi:hypothetical protein AB4320_23560 [Vibrio splendidus]|nr:hypothetical protein [Vibrio sp.]
MKYTLVRNIYFHSPDAGLVSKYVSKEVESDVNPLVGFEFEDSAWHRNDSTIAENISIDTETGKCTVNLNSLDVGSKSDVQKIFDIAVNYHGWSDWLKNS